MKFARRRASRLGTPFLERSLLSKLIFLYLLQRCYENTADVSFHCLANVVRTFFISSLAMEGVQLTVHGLDCGDAFANGGVPAAASDCNMLCAGNSEEFCGGPNRLNVYNYTGTDLPAHAPGGGNGPTNVFPVTSPLPGSFSYAGCYV